MTVRIRCVKPLVVNLAEGVQLSRVGEEADIAALTHFWQGQVARGAIEVVTPAPKGAAEPEPKSQPESKPEPEPKAKRRGRQAKR